MGIDGGRLVSTMLSDGRPHVSLPDGGRLIDGGRIISGGLQDGGKGFDGGRALTPIDGQIAIHI